VKKLNSWVFLICVLSLFFASAYGYGLSCQGSVDVEFNIIKVYWGTYDTSVTPEPGDRNVPLTIVIQQHSSYYLRAIVGYLNLTEYFKDSSSGENVSTAQGVAIERENETGDVIPYGSFYLTFYLDISEDANKGTYSLNLNLSYVAINSTGFYDGVPKNLPVTITIPNRAPEIDRADPESATITVYVGDNETFSIEASDPDNDTLYYKWKLDGDLVAEGDNTTSYFYEPTNDDIGSHTVAVEVSDGDLTTTHTWSVSVENRGPEITSVEPSSAAVTIIAGDSKTFSVSARDPDNDTLYYEWTLDGDTVAKGEDVTSYTYNTTEDDFGTHTLTVKVSDNYTDVTNTWTINVDLPSRTKIYKSADHIYAGKRTNLSITINNNLWQGTVDVSVSYPTYVAIFSDTEWTFHNVSPGDNITIFLEMYVPAKVIAGMYGEIELIGQTLQLTVDVSFTDKYGNSYSESYDVGLVIRGHIELRYFDYKVSPYPAIIGSETEISVTVLNMGLATAQFANVSIIPQDYIELVSGSFMYIGDIEPNSPIPFSLKFKFKDGVDEGNYTVGMLLYYYDDMYNLLNETIILIIPAAYNTTTVTTETGFNIQEYVGYIYVAVIGVVLAIIYVVRKKKIATG